MDLKGGLLELTTHLRQLKIDAAVIGGFAMAAHGVARATIDIDILARGDQRKDLEQILAKMNLKIIHTSAEVIQAQGVIHLDILLANRIHTLEIIKDAQLFPGFPLPVVRVEDLIGLKIQAYMNDKSRELRDKADIQSLILKNPNLDWSRVQKYAALFGQEQTLEGLRK